jgi:hypothetical protein
MRVRERRDVGDKRCSVDRGHASGDADRSNVPLRYTDVKMRGTDLRQHLAGQRGELCVVLDRFCALAVTLPYSRPVDAFEMRIVEALVYRAPERLVKSSVVCRRLGAHRGARKNRGQYRDGNPRTPHGIVDLPKRDDSLIRLHRYVQLLRLPSMTITESPICSST